MNNKKIDIRTLNLETLKTIMKDGGQQAFRAKQIWQWLWQKGITDFEAMTNLSKPLRAWLNENFVIQGIEIETKQVSQDGTIKVRFKLHDDFLVEGVLIPTDGRYTACVSSQVGCSLTCKFCATGKMKRERNLTAGEIFDQVFQINELAEQHYNEQLSNIVYMGMGEPLLNYNNVLQSIERITAEDGLHRSPRRITVSTAGIAKLIKKLADDNKKINLAISLHAANDEKRDKIMPINEQNSLAALKEALKYYYDQTGRMVYYEYILFNNFNESVEDALELVDFCRNIPCKVNMIEYNTVEGTGLEKAKEEKLLRFQQTVANQGITITLRRSRGKDIDAACGQLANKG